MGSTDLSHRRGVRLGASAKLLTQGAGPRAMRVAPASLANDARDLPGAHQEANNSIPTLIAQEVDAATVGGDLVASVSFS